MKGGQPRRFLGSTASLSPSGSSPSSSSSSSNNGSILADDDNLYSNALLLAFGMAVILFLVCLAVSICRHLLFLWVRRVERRRQKEALPEFVRSKICELMPKTTYGGGGSDDGKLSSGCAICLSDEFEAGEEIRVFPECGHGFHAECVDVWLVSHLSCPLCRQMLMWRPASTCCSSCFNC